MTHVTCWLTAKNRDQLRNPTLGNRVLATFTLYCALRGQHSRIREPCLCVDSLQSQSSCIVRLTAAQCTRHFVCFSTIIYSTFAQTITRKRKASVWYPSVRPSVQSGAYSKRLTREQHRRRQRILAQALRAQIHFF